MTSDSQPPNWSSSYWVQPYKFNDRDWRNSDKSISIQHRDIIDLFTITDPPTWTTHTVLCSGCSQNWLYFLSLQATFNLGVQGQQRCILKCPQSAMHKKTSSRKKYCRFLWFTVHSNLWTRNNEMKFIPVEFWNVLTRCPHTALAKKIAKHFELYVGHPVNGFNRLFLFFIL